jgi:DNA-binding response OmpR family regulator
MRSIIAGSKQEWSRELLFVSTSAEDRFQLRHLLPEKYTLHEASAFAEAARVLRERRISVLLCASELPDWSWRQFVEGARTRHPQVIVVSRLADERLWAEALNLGAYDMLLTPFEAEEVTRVIGLASRAWKGASVRIGAMKRPGADYLPARATV